MLALRLFPSSIPESLDVFECIVGVVALWFSGDERGVRKSTNICHYKYPPIPLSDNAQIGMGLVMSPHHQTCHCHNEVSSLVVSMVSRSTPAQIWNQIPCSLLHGLATQPTVVLPCRFFVAHLLPVRHSLCWVIPVAS
jgi:hypothetical protein